MVYNPIVMQTKVSDTEVGKKYLEANYMGFETIKHDFELILEQDTYEETLAMVKEYDPLLVLPANERGVVLASKLANGLNLLCNDIENLDAMTLKHEMQNLLAECELRHIRGKNVKTLEDAIAFYDGEGLDEVVIKPVYGRGSTSVRICEDRNEFIEAFKSLLDKTNEYGDVNENLSFRNVLKGKSIL